jgi:Matrixin
MLSLAATLRVHKPGRSRCRGVIGAFVLALLGNAVLALTPARADSTCPYTGTEVNNLTGGSILYGSSYDHICSNDAGGGHGYPNQAFDFMMQHDGNLVLYAGRTKAIWALSWLTQSSTPSYPSQRHALVTDSRVELQSSDGNLVVKDPSNNVIWASMTNGHTSDYLTMNRDGNAVIYSGGTPNTALWSTSTGEPSADTIGIAGGDCWDTAARQCTKTNSGLKNTFAYFRAIDQTGQSGWTTPIKNAAHAWDNYGTSPQYYDWCDTNNSNCVYTPHSGDIWFYIKTIHTGGTLPDGTGMGTGYGITFECDNSDVCTSNWDPLVVKWGTIFLNVDTIGTSPQSAGMEEIVTHEMGHSLGLAHNWSVSSASSAVMYPFSDPSCSSSCGGIQGLDIGANPGCGSHHYGDDCIYGYGD